jgi:hypothetical protein
MKLTARKHVRAPPRRDTVPTESHSDGQDAGYFSRTLRTMLLALGSSEPPLFIGTLRLLRGNTYLWRVCVVIYERPTTDHPAHLPSSRGPYTKVDVRARHERGSP